MTNDSRHEAPQCSSRGSWWCAGFSASWGQIHSESISLELTSEVLVRQGLLTLYLRPVTHQEVG